MANECIPLLGYRTGSVETPGCVRHAFVFDLTRIDLRDRTVVSARLHLPQGRATDDISAVALSDPSTRAAFGRASGRTRPRSTPFARGANRTHRTAVTLSAEALHDLRNAAGGVFSVDAILEDTFGAPASVTWHGAERVWLMVVAKLAGGVARRPRSKRPATQDAAA
jgi:hypothetical protein